jgi:hypothetical protein
MNNNYKDNSSENFDASFLDAGMRKEKDEGFQFPDISVASILKTTAITIAGGYAIYTLKQINDKLDLPPKE